MSSLKHAALAEADRCVKCGLCLPHCPTYQLYRNENASPRGRIALAEALLKGEVQLDHTAKQHIDQCLLCQQCEKVCPSQVRYSQIIDAVRQQWVKPSWSSKLARKPKLFSTAMRFARYLPPFSGAPTSLRLAHALPQNFADPKPGFYPATGKARAHVGLLPGCVTQPMQPNALHASIRLLNALGYSVILPPKTVCCGALMAHQGELAAAEKVAELNKKIYTADLDIVLTTASGCAAYWHQHPFSQLATDDIVAFLALPENLYRLNFHPLAQTVALYQPCSMINTLGAVDAQRKLLAQLPEVQLFNLGEPGDCCGSAGNQMLTQRKQAVTLRKPLLEKLRQNPPNYLATNNIGCALHLAEGIQQMGLKIPTLHPVEILEKQR